MPRRLIAIGLLYCLGGIIAIVETISAWTRSQISLNLSFFLLPIGIGLLRGKTRSRWWARFWIILGYIAAGLMILLAFLFPDTAQVSWFSGAPLRGSQAIPYLIMFALIITGILRVLHIALYSGKVSAYFQERGR